jgi:hypothetical protein
MRLDAGAAVKKFRMLGYEDSSQKITDYLLKLESEVDRLKGLRSPKKEL